MSTFKSKARWRSHRPLPKVSGRYFPAKQIIPNLWIGSQGDSQDGSFFAARNIRLVVNATGTIPFLDLPDVQTVRVPVDDDPNDNEIMLRHLPVVVLAMDDVLKHGLGVLVHCHAGMQRSAAVVAGYLMWKRGMTTDQALEFINRKKHETFWPRATFEAALRSWETVLRRNGRIK